LAVAKKLYVGDNIVMTSGKGIDFSATANGSGTTTSEVLSDYEEGTWTPTVVGLSAAGLGTYGAQVGIYTRVGRKVTANLYISITAHTGTGNIEFGGLPFASKGGANYLNAAAIGFLDGLSLTAGNVATAYVGAGVSTITLQQTPSGGGASAAVPMDTVFSIILSVTYFTA
jgi:hypothetical protein